MQTKRPSFNNIPQYDSDGYLIDPPQGAGFLQLNPILKQRKNETTEAQAARIFSELMNFITKKKGEPAMLGLVYAANAKQAAAMHRYIASPYKYRRKAGKTKDSLPEYEFTLNDVLETLKEAHNQGAVFRDLLGAIDKQIRLGVLKPDDILVYPVSTSKRGGSSPHIENKIGVIVTPFGNIVDINILNRDLSALQLAVAQGREIHCPPRPHNPDEYAIGGGVSKFFDNPDIASVTIDGQKISQSAYVQRVLRDIAQYKPVDLPFTVTDTASQKKQAPIVEAILQTPQAPMVAYHPGLPSVEEAAQNYDTIYSRHLPVKLTIAGEGDEEKDIHIITWNVMAYDNLNGFAKASPQYGETTEQKTDRYKRIATALKCFVQQDTIDFITLQEIDPDHVALQFIRYELPDYYKLATHRDVKRKVVTLYNAERYQLVGDTKIDSILNSEVNCFETLYMEEVESYEIFNVLAPLSLPISTVERHIKNCFKTTLTWNGQPLENACKFIVGDFNKTMHSPTQEHRINTITSVISEYQRKNNGQGAAAGDGGFFSIDDAIYQIDMKPLNPVTGVPFTEAELAPLQTENLCETQRQEILCGRSIPRLDKRVINKVWFNGLTLRQMERQWVRYNNSLYAPGSNQAGEITVREAVNLQNESGLTLTLTSPKLYQQLKACAKPRLFTINSQTLGGQKVYTIIVAARQVEQFCHLPKVLKKRYQMLHYIDQQFDSYCNPGFMVTTFRGARTVDKTQADKYEKYLLKNVRAGNMLLAMLQAAREEDHYLTNKVNHQPGSFKLRLDNIRIKLKEAYPDLEVFAGILILYRNINPKLVDSFANDIQQILLAHPDDLLKIVRNYLPQFRAESVLGRKEQLGIEVKVLTAKEKEFLVYLRNELCTYALHQTFDKPLQTDNHLSTLVEVSGQYLYLHNWLQDPEFKDDFKEIRYKQLWRIYQRIIQASPVPEFIENIAQYLANQRAQFPELVKRYTEILEELIQEQEDPTILLNSINHHLDQAIDDMVGHPDFMNGLKEIMHFIPLKDHQLVQFMCVQSKAKPDLVTEYFAKLIPQMQHAETMLRKGTLGADNADYNKLVKYLEDDDPKLKSSLYRDPFLLELNQVWTAALTRMLNAYTHTQAKFVFTTEAEANELISEFEEMTPYSNSMLSR